MQGIAPVNLLLSAFRASVDSAQPSLLGPKEPTPLSQSFGHSGALALYTQARSSGSPRGKIPSLSSLRLLDREWNSTGKWQKTHGKWKTI